MRCVHSILIHSSMKKYMLLKVVGRRHSPTSTGESAFPSSLLFLMAMGRQLGEESRWSLLDTFHAFVDFQKGTLVERVRVVKVCVLSEIFGGHHWEATATERT